MDDRIVQRFVSWLQTRTLCPRPRDRIRGVPKIWNEACDKVEDWPQQTLSRISFKAASDKLAWDDLPDSFRQEAEAYLKLRAAPDLFKTDPSMPKRPLASSTIRQQREHIRLAVSVLVMSLHDFRRSAATFLAMTAPDKANREFVRVHLSAKPDRSGSGKNVARNTS